MKDIYKVVACGDSYSVRSDKSETGQLAKRTLVLQAWGGKYEDQFVVTLLGNDAQCQFYAGDMVLASLRCLAREYNGQMYQDITASYIRKMSL